MSFLDDVDNDHTENADILRQKVKQASFFGIIAVFSFALLYANPNGSVYLGVIPGFCLGMMASILGGAFFKYRKYKKLTIDK